MMNKQMQYLVEGITRDVIACLMKDNGWNLTSAISRFYNSETFAKLSEEATGLYMESSAYIYSLFKEEMKHGLNSTAL